MDEPFCARACRDGFHERKVGDAALGNCGVSIGDHARGIGSCAELPILYQCPLRLRGLLSLLMTAHPEAPNSDGRVFSAPDGANWTVFFGASGAKLVYSKTFVRRDQFVTFELTYPRGSAVRYKSVAEQLSRCFRLVSSGF